jgi:hypothetical protein
VQFSAVAATAYKIQVSGYDNGSGPATGPFTLRVSDVFPQTIIDSGPGATSDSTPTWAFHSTVAGSAFTCVVYTLPAFDVTDSAGCISTYTAPTLALGSYEFDVYSQGPGGEFSLDSAARAFTVGAAPLPPPLPPPTPTPPHKKKCKKKAKKASAAKKKCKKKK